MSFVNTRDVIGDQATLDGLVAHTLTELKEDGINTLRPYAMYGNQGLQSVEMPGLASDAGFPTSAFAYCTSLTYAAFPNIQRIASNMFIGCKNLSAISASSILYMSSAAFHTCYKLESANFPLLTTFGGASQFMNCGRLESCVLSSALSILTTDVFKKCITLRSIEAPNVSLIGTYAFYDCHALMHVSFPYATAVYSNAFNYTAIGKLNFPLLSNTPSYMTNCAAEVEFGAQVYLSGSVFAYDYNLLSLVLSHSSVCTLALHTALAGTPIASGYGHIFVPDSLVSVYKEETNWVTYASQIMPISEYPKTVVTDTITDSWSDIFASEENGTYTSKYHIGDTKVVDIGAFQIIMQIVAMDTDELADNTGNAKITWMTLYSPFHAMMHISDSCDGGWENCNIRSGLLQSIYDNMDSIVKTSVKTVKKTFCYSSGEAIHTAEDKIWIPSHREIFGGTSLESAGCDYTAFFTNNSARVKRCGLLGIGPTDYWWLRSSETNGTSFRVVDNSGTQNSRYASSGTRVVFGFCT